MSSIVVGGEGQVGSAIVNILVRHGQVVSVLDKSNGSRPAMKYHDFMHVCIPHSSTFLKDVKAEMRAYKPRWVIVHSTVPVGTTRKLGPNAAHSPVRGQHDKLEWSLLRFIKYVAGVTPKAGKAAQDHLLSCNFPAFRWSKPEDTELMKELCLSRYLNDLAFYERAEKICRKYGVGPGLLMHWTDSYNDGYANTSYVRPAFTFPRGKVGGHCVMPVSKMLYEQTRDECLGRNIKLFSGSCNS